MDDQRLFQEIKGQASETEQRAIDAWRRLSPANESRYEAVRRVLQITAGTRTGIRTLDTAPPPVLDILQVAAARAHVSKRRAWVQRALVAAASVAAVLAISVAYQKSRSASEFGFEEMVSGDAQPVTVSLRDGSVMRLAPRSRARVRVRDGVR